METVAADVIINLQNRAISDFEDLLCKLNKGYTDVDYCNILQIISFILLSSDFDKIGLIYENLISK